MRAAGPGVEQSLTQGQICSFLSFPPDRDEHWDKRFRERIRAKERQENLGGRSGNRHNQRQESGTKIEIQRKKDVSQRHREKGSHGIKDTDSGKETHEVREKQCLRVIGQW